MVKEAVKLSEAQTRGLVALAREREQVMQQAQREIDGIGAAIDELLRVYGLALQMPAGKRFAEQREDGVYLVVEQEEEEHVEKVD